MQAKEATRASGQGKVSCSKTVSPCRSPQWQMVNAAGAKGDYAGPSHNSMRALREVSCYSFVL